MIETIASYEDHCNAIKAQKRQKKKEAIERAEKHICNPIPRRMKTWLFQRLPVYFMQKTQVKQHVLHAIRRFRWI